MELKPFHVAIVNIINDCGLCQLPLIGRLLETTKIPDNHDAIIEAFNKKAIEFNFEGHVRVMTSIMDQRENKKEEKS